MEWDAVCVLSGPYQKFRFKKGLELAEREKTKHFILCGKDFRMEYYERARQKLNEQVWWQPCSRTTYEDAYITAKCYAGNLYDKLALVTSEAHMPRAHYLFNLCHPPSFQIDKIKAPPSWREDLRFTFREFRLYLLTKLIFAGTQRGDLGTYEKRGKLLERVRSKTFKADQDSATCCYEVELWLSLMSEFKKLVQKVRDLIKF